MSPRSRDDVSASLSSMADLTAGGYFVAIRDYVRSIAATETVSKDQVFRFLEMQFARADRDHDGELDLDELAAFVHAVSCPETDQR
jgi:hypothetical protein